MMTNVAGSQTASPIPGKKKNCDTWAMYETMGSSSSATLCHGGRYDGKLYQPCPARFECKQQTIYNGQNQEPQLQHRQLPVMNSPSYGAPLRQIVSQTSQSQTPSFRPMQFGASTLPSLQQQRPQMQVPQRHFESSFPQPIIPPADYPEAMRTPYASATPVYGGGTSPTFLPQNGENVIERLTKNVMQGMLAACGWHLFDYSRSIDMFR